MMPSLITNTSQTTSYKNNKTNKNLGKRPKTPRPNNNDNYNYKHNYRCPKNPTPIWKKDIWNPDNPMSVTINKQQQ